VLKGTTAAKSSSITHYTPSDRKEEKYGGKKNDFFGVGARVYHGHFTGIQYFFMLGIFMFMEQFPLFIQKKQHELTPVFLRCLLSFFLMYMVIR